MSDQAAQKIDESKILTAKVLIEIMKSRGPLERLSEAEFKVFSQFGDDGIIQYLINNVSISTETFIEFGVENYLESNTRFLLVNNNWSGLVMDHSEQYVKFIRNDEIYWKHELTAVQAFITRDNINEIISQNGFAGEIGLLSIDVDGNDYWIWESIECVSPIIAVLEYNSVFGARHAVTVPYDKMFNRTEAHYSNLYWGASLKALCLLATRKGYGFVGCNSGGNNAYFVRKDKLGLIKTTSVERGYVLSHFRESRDRNGRLTYVTGADRFKVIGDMMVYDVERDMSVPLRDLRV